jgi:hypothetical protein
MDDQKKEQSRNEYKNIGELVFDGRFRIREHKQEQVKTRFGDVEVRDVIYVDDLRNTAGNPLRLIQMENTPRPTFKARIFYELTKDEYIHAKGEDFEISKPAGVIVHVEDVQPTHAVLVLPDPADPSKPPAQKRLPLTTEAGAP